MDPLTHSRIETPRRVTTRPATTCLGTWELIDAVGLGSWSTVFRARPRRTAGSADYAIKVAEVSGAATAQASALIAREAHVGARVAHPHLIAVLSADLDAAVPYLVMPFLHGATLRDTLAHCGRLATPHALWIVRQVASALAALHAAGWLHADLKPSNIHVSPEGHATLIDLGLAMRLGSPECAAGASLRGTLVYTAPEMISPVLGVDAQTDVYSLGVTLYELLTGQPPFHDDDPERLMTAHLEHAAPNPRRWVPGLSHDVSRLLRDMLAKEPLRRPTTAELGQRLIDLEITTLWERVA